MKPLMTAGLANAVRMAYSAPASRQRRSILSTDFSDSARSSDMQRQEMAAWSSPTVVSREACTMTLVGEGALAWLALVSGDGELVALNGGCTGLSMTHRAATGVSAAAGVESWRGGPERSRDVGSRGGVQGRHRGERRRWGGAVEGRARGDWEWRRVDAVMHCRTGWGGVGMGKIRVSTDQITLNLVNERDIRGKPSGGTMRVEATQIPDGNWMQYAANDREQSGNMNLPETTRLQTQMIVLAPVTAQGLMAFRMLERHGSTPGHEFTTWQRGPFLPVNLGRLYQVRTAFPAQLEEQAGAHRKTVDLSSQLSDVELCCFDREPSSISLSASVPDPMLFESQLSLEGSFLAPSSPSEEALPVAETPAPALSLSPTPAASSQTAVVASTTRGASLEPLLPVSVPTDLPSFAQALRKPLGPSVLPSPPPLRRPRHRAALLAPPHRSSRLAKKAVCRTPSLIAAQNLLMRKLGLSGDSQLESGDFDRYIQMFKNGLTEEQTKLISELFVCSVPASVGLVGSEEAV
ncbi:hypothetical protein BAE44_0001127 [Dichanthelium oligosanthes]|uniref:Uncharacterized protein n=1 Tax=Dichanthelium oligosanthes TaxID=888268 RepID=A0A1E5WKJ6_9POAL|nr:hypothetical protein BAE44_0001127 [Dichanthelium oligosanthes]